MTERSRGTYYLQQAEPIELKYEVPSGLALNQNGAEEFAHGLQQIISMFGNELNPWVQSMGGQGYSEIAAISQYMFLTFIGATSQQEIDRFSRSGFPQKAHLVWRIVSALDDVADSGGLRFPGSIQDVTDSEGVSIARMIDEFTRILGFPLLGKWMAEQILSSASRHETNNQRTFDQAVKSKQKTTGMFTAAGVLAVWPYFLKTFPSKTLHASLPHIMRQAVSGSLIAQVIDDLVDLPRDLARSGSSSLVIAALCDAEELDRVRQLSANTPVSVAVVLNEELKAGDRLLQFYLNQRKNISPAFTPMLNYFDHQFLFSRARNVNY